jgi:hypothetical protein
MEPEKQSLGKSATAAAGGTAGKLIISVHDNGFVNEELNNIWLDDREARKRKNKINALQLKLLKRKFLKLLERTCECEHPPEFALALLPKFQSHRGPIQVKKGKIATNIADAVLCAEENVKELNAKIESLKAKQSPTPADSQELARALVNLPLAKEMTDPGRYSQDKKGRVWVQHPKCVAHDREMLCGWPLQKFPKGVFEEAARLLQELDKLPGTDRAFVSTKKDNSTYLMVTCLRALAEAGVDGAAVAAGKYHLPLKRGMVTQLRLMLAARPIRGDPRSDEFNLVTQQLEFQIDQLKRNVPARAFIPELLDRMSKCDPNYGIDDPEGVLGPVEIDGKMYKIPASLREIVYGARRGDLQQIIDWGLGYKEIASLIPQMLAAAVADASATADASAAADAARPHPAFTVLKIIVEVFLSNFPHRLLPNNLIEELRELAKQASIELLLVGSREIAQLNSFGRCCSQLESNSIYAARLAAKASSQKLYGTDLYADFFGIPLKIWLECYELTIFRYADFGNGHMAGYAKWLNMDYSSLDSHSDDAVSEALKVLTTQNLAQLFGLGLTFDCVKLAALTWSQIIAMITNADNCWVKSDCAPRITECISSRFTQATLQLEMDVTNAWRQFVYYVSHVNDKIGLLARLEKESGESPFPCSPSDSRKRATHDYCVKLILHPLIDVVNGSLPVRRTPLHFDIWSLNW